MGRCLHWHEIHRQHGRESVELLCHDLALQATFESMSYDFYDIQRVMFYLGLSGMNKIPMESTNGQMIPMPTTVRQEPAPLILRVPMEMQSAGIISGLELMTGSKRTGD